MTQKDIRIGIVGANSTASWAKVSHIPAIQSLQGVKLAAVATRSEQSAREAADAFGAEHWFSDPFAMIRDDRIDLVTVASTCPRTETSSWRRWRPARPSAARRL